MNEAARVLDLLETKYYTLHTHRCATYNEIPFTCDCGGEKLTERLKNYLRTQANPEASPK